MNPGMKKPLRASLFTVFFHSPDFGKPSRLLKLRQGSAKGIPSVKPFRE